MSERGIVMICMIGLITVGVICCVIFEAVQDNHQQAMACIQAGGSSTQWGCFAKGVDIQLERRPLLGSAK
jgi:hypothetical protein